MATVPLPPNRAKYVRIFGVSLIVIVAALVYFLFGVSMEATVPATGVLKAKDQLHLRAPHAGVIELGWYEGEGFHKLTTGDHVWPGQVLASIRTTAPGVGQPPAGWATSLPPGATQFALRAPKLHVRWQVLKVNAEAGAAIAAGDVVATLAPIDPHTHEPLDVIAQLAIAEQDSKELVIGQKVRLQSNVYQSRLHGFAEGTLLSIDPVAEVHPDGNRYFHAAAAITQAPFPLRLGSSVTGKVVIGRKSVYQIILEH